jgi:hypothetical protein
VLGYRSLGMKNDGSGSASRSWRMESHGVTAGLSWSVWQGYIHSCTWRRCRGIMTWRAPESRWWPFSLEFGWNV